MTIGDCIEFKFDKALFCRMVDIRDGGIRYYNLFFIENEIIFSMEKFKQTFTKGKKFERSEERMTTVIDVHGRLMQLMLRTIIIANVGHKTFAFL